MLLPLIGAAAEDYQWDSKGSFEHASQGGS